jgi:hypothetical protein
MLRLADNQAWEQLMSYVTNFVLLPSDEERARGRREDEPDRWPAIEHLNLLISSTSGGEPGFIEVGVSYKGWVGLERSAWVCALKHINGDEMRELIGRVEWADAPNLRVMVGEQDLWWWEDLPLAGVATPDQGLPDARFAVDGFPLGRLGLEGAEIVHGDGRREPFEGVLVDAAAGQTIIEAIIGCLPPGSSLVMPGGFTYAKARN